MEKADMISKMFEWMLPKGADQLKFSKMNLAGAGTRMMKDLMKKGVMSLQNLIKEAAEFGVEIVVCEKSMDLTGIRREEIIDYPNISIAGVAGFPQEAGRSKVTLFI